MEWENVINQFSTEFLKKREQAEGFDASKHSFYIHDPEMQYLSMLLTGYIDNHYYMSAKEVMELAVPLHRNILLKDPDFHMESLKVARRYGAMKDQVMIGLLLWSKHPNRKEKFGEISELLSTFPPNQIVRKFINTKRNEPKLFGGLGTFEKKLLKHIWSLWAGQGKIYYYFAKYRRYMQQIVNVAHIRVSEKEFSYLSNPTKYVGNSDYLLSISKFLSSKDPRFLPDKAPFELVRSNIPKINWTVDILKKCDITGNTVVLQACSLYEAFKEEILDYIERAVNSPTVTADKILKALIMAAEKDYEDLAESLAKAYVEKVKIAYQQLLLPLPEKPSMCLVIDASGSMYPGCSGGYFTKVIASVAPFAPLVRSLILFSDNAGTHDPSLLMSWDGINEIQEIASTKYNSCTDITAALELAKEQKEVNTVIIATDEQANVTTSERTEMEHIKDMLDDGIKVIVLNPTPYPIHISDIRDKRLIYVPAPNPESVTAALKLIQLRKELQNATAKEVIAKLLQ